MLASALQALPKDLRSLCLFDGQIGNENLKKIFVSLVENDHCREIEEIRLGNQSLALAGAETISNAFPLLTSLTDLRIWGGFFLSSFF